MPYNVYSINVTLYGAAGGYDYQNQGYYGGSPGYGGLVEAKLTVTPQSTLCVTVGMSFMFKMMISKIITALLTSINNKADRGKVGLPVVLKGIFLEALMVEEQAD